jgi:imidazolonepropionase-like amidohydrolase
MTAFIFADCALLDGTRNERREDHHVLVEGGHIREVSDQPIKSASAETIALGGRTLMPGLVDAHVHVLAVDAALARLSDRPVTLLTLQAAKVLEGMLQRGFTRIRDAAGADGGLAEAVEEGLVRGPRIFPAGMALSQTAGMAISPRARSRSMLALVAAEGWQCRALPTASRSAVARRATNCAKGRRRSKIVASGGVVSPTIRSGTCNTVRRKSRRREPGTLM